MSDKLPNPPIIEAVLDVGCDMPPGLDLETLKAEASIRFGDRYPKSARRFEGQVTIETGANAPPAASLSQGLQGLVFLQEDERQLVQIRTTGFSFNRLAPYEGLDEYLPEIQRAWAVFVDLVSPLLIRRVTMRYINRILLPLQNGHVELDRYLAIGPRLPKEEEDVLTFIGFFHRQQAMEVETGNFVTTTLASQAEDQKRLPIIFDIEASAETPIENPRDWLALQNYLSSLRSLKNRVFQRTLTKQCLTLFQ